MDENDSTSQNWSHRVGEKKKPSPELKDLYFSVWWTKMQSQNKEY